MISTRQLIFTLSIVFYFVNRATSGNIGSSDAPFESLLDGSSTLSSDVELEDVEEVEDVEEINTEHLYCCKLELTTTFQMAKPFDNFLHAFLYKNKADFLVRRTYTRAAYEYFNDLLNTAQDLNQPALENPRQYCINHHREQGVNCLRGIAEIGCQPDDVGVICFKKLYLDWKRDESIVYSSPYYGTGNISDERLANAISRGINSFPGLSPENLLSRLSDENILEDYYREHEDRRREINDLKSTCDNYLRHVRAAIADDRRSPSNITRWNIGVANENYDHHNTQYTRQRDADIRGARHKCYGINKVPYSTLLDEHNRRLNLHKQLGDSYAMYLYNEIQMFGRNMGLDSEENKIFQDPETFCTRFLINNPHYYDDL